jgi:hypothetical protein
MSITETFTTSIRQFRTHKWMSRIAGLSMLTIL